MWFFLFHEISTRDHEEILTDYPCCKTHSGIHTDNGVAHKLLQGCPHATISSVDYVSTLHTEETVHSLVCTGYLAMHYHMDANRRAPGIVGAK